MWVSTMLVLGSKWKSQTFSSSMVRVTTSPAWRSRYSRILNSWASNSMRLPARVTVRDRRSISRAPTKSEVADEKRGRRHDWRPSRKCPHPGEKLGEGEGLDQIVVAAGFEAGDAVVDS